VLSAPELAAVNELLATEQCFQEEGIQHGTLRSFACEIMLWGVVDGKFGRLDLVAVDDSAALLWSKMRTGMHSAVSHPQRDRLRQLISRIREGKEPHITETKERDE